MSWQDGTARDKLVRDLALQIHGQLLKNLSREHVLVLARGTRLHLAQLLDVHQCLRLPCAERRHWQGDQIYIGWQIQILVIFNLTLSRSVASTFGITISSINQIFVRHWGYNSYVEAGLGFTTAERPVTQCDVTRARC